MTRYFIQLVVLIALIGFTSCEDEKESAGEPVLTITNQFTSAHFGDSIAFTANVSDMAVPLSTLKAQLFFGEEMVSETVIRTKTDGQYNGKIFVPFLQNVPNGTATLKFVLQNIRFALVEQSFNLPLTRPDYPQLTLVTPEGEFTMVRTGLHQYSVTNRFPQKVKGFIRTPVLDNKGNQVTFGWVNGAIKEGSVLPIPFSNATAGTYPITFNTLTYAASPFVILRFAGTEMSMIDDNNYRVEMNLTQDQTIVVTGIADLNTWWIDEDFFSGTAGGALTFRPVTGKYRVTANFARKYFIVEAMTGNALSTLQADGTGALWIIGTGIGKPTLENEVGWNTGKALYMSQVAPKIYQVTVVAGTSIHSTNINFKFFHQKGWGGEYTHAALTSTSNIVFVGAGGSVNGRDPGNLGILAGQSLTPGNKYIFSVDITGGRNNAVLSVTQQ